MVYNVYDFDDFDKFKKESYIVYDIFTNVKSNTDQQKFYKIGCGFDIETTKVGHKGYMYHWQFSLGFNVILGRTWEQFIELYNSLNEWLKKSKVQLLCWVANLGFEFQFFRKRIPITDTFSTRKRSPITVNSGLIEFRDALYLSGLGGLANLAKTFCTKEDITINYNGETFTVKGNQKLKGDLDYSKSRNSLTPLTKTEKQYTINDVTILSEFGMYCFNNFNHKIPITSTGIVRQMIKDELPSNSRYNVMRKGIKPLFPKKAITYDIEMEYLFRGGYTHANMWFVGDTVENVFGVDFTSSYPAVMLHFEYPMSPFVKPFKGVETNGKHITDSRFNINSKWAFVLDVRFKGIKAKTHHTIESKHKIITSVNAKFDNNRLYSADEITVKICEVDYFIYEMFYEWESIEIINVKSCIKGKLPDYLLNPMKREYQKKCILKREGQEGTTEYKNAKSHVNSNYGMCVTRLVMESIKYNVMSDITGEEPWYKDVEDCETYEQLIEHQLLSPYWGMWITAYARYQLLSVVYEIDKGEDTYVIYCDTDSIYMIDTPRNREIVNNFNMSIYAQNSELPDEFYDIGAFDEIMIKGDETHGGFTFKTLGAKRYIKYKNNHCEVTVAGLKKGSYEKTLIRQDKTDDSVEMYEGKEIIGYVHKDDLFDNFENGLSLGKDDSEKTTHSYNDDEHSDIVIDEFGNSEEMREKSSVGIYEIPFSLTMEIKYLAMLEIIKEEKRIYFHDLETKRRNRVH